jgi:hypothetical protein
MKHLIIFTLFFCLKVNSQIIIEEEFNGGTTAPVGWTFTSIAAGSAGPGNYGKSSSGVAMDGTGDRIQTPIFVAGTANSICFWTKSTSATNANPIDIEYNVLGVWTACTGSPFTGIQSTARTCVVTFPATATQLRLTYTKTVAQNVYIDDIIVYLNTGLGCTSTDFLSFNSITFNSCNAAACEGTDEFLSFTNGNNALNISNLEIEFPTSGGSTTYCGNTTTPCDEYFTTNPAYVALLNAVIGCTALNFLTPPTGVIPANAKVLVFGGNPPSSTIDFGTLCGSGAVYYCVFGSNTLDCVGKYSNTAATTRYTSIRNRATGCSVERSFTPSSGANLDGDIVVFDAIGTPSFASNASCAGFIILPIQLLDFYATKNNSQNDIVWKVAQEENIKNYILEKSENGIDFTELITIAANNEIQTKTYSAIDEAPYSEITYYRLKTKENNGSIVTHKIISVDENNKDWTYSHYQQENNLVLEFKNNIPKNTSAEIFDLSGKQLISSTIHQTQTIINTENLSAGIYFVRLSNPYKTDHFKIIISN